MWGMRGELDAMALEGKPEIRGGGGGWDQVEVEG